MERAMPHRAVTSAVVHEPTAARSFPDKCKLAPGCKSFSSAMKTILRNYSSALRASRRRVGTDMAGEAFESLPDG